MIESSEADAILLHGDVISSTLNFIISACGTDAGWTVHIFPQLFILHWSSRTSFSFAVFRLLNPLTAMSAYGVRMCTTKNATASAVLFYVVTSFMDCS